MRKMPWSIRWALALGILTGKFVATTISWDQRDDETQITLVTFDRELAKRSYFP